jgi:hypothetical protein
MNKVYKIEQLTDSGPIMLEETESQKLDELESSQLIVENTNNILIGIFTDEYLEFVKQLLTKHNIEFTITDLTSVMEC